MTKKFFTLEKCADYGQSNRVYEWEDNLFEHKTKELWTLEGCQDFTNNVWQDLKLDKKQAVPKIVDGRGSSAARTDGVLHIHLPKWSRNPVVVLHEIAHCITDFRDEDDSLGHGGLYMHTYLRMLERYYGVNSKKLALSARKFGLMVSERCALPSRLGKIKF